MIKNLIFDFGKVLVDYEYFETLDQIFQNHEQAEEFYHLLIDGKWNENMDRGLLRSPFCRQQKGILPVSDCTSGRFFRKSPCRV